MSFYLQWVRLGTHVEYSATASAGSRCTRLNNGDVDVGRISVGMEPNGESGKPIGIMVHQVSF
jgi:hypothetical protein